MDRRGFIRAGSLALAGLAAGTTAPRALHGARPFPKAGEDATVYEAVGISEENLRALLAGVGGIERLLRVPPAQATVLLKPNLCLPDPPERGTGTSPEVLALLCKILVETGVRRIVIADHTLRGSAAEFERHPVFGIPRRYPAVKVVLANEQRMYEPVHVDGRVLRSTERLKLLSRADLFINVATAKHHSATQVSLGVKNLMGVIWNRADFHTTMDLSQAIGDLAVLIRPDLTIVDASRVLLTGGPTGPGKIALDMRMFASRDMVAVDSAVVGRYPFGDRSIRPHDIPHLRSAAELGVGVDDLDRITLTRV